MIVGKSARCRQVIHGQVGGNFQTVARHESGEIVAPRNRYCYVPDGVFDDQIPTDDPCEKLAEARVGICVGRTGHWNSGSEIRITERRESTSDGRKDE